MLVSPQAAGECEGRTAIEGGVANAAEPRRQRGECEGRKVNEGGVANLVRLEGRLIDPAWGTQRYHCACDALRHDHMPV